MIPLQGPCLTDILCWCCRFTGGYLAHGCEQGTLVEIGNDTPLSFILSMPDEEENDFIVKVVKVLLEMQNR